MYARHKWNHEFEDLPTGFVQVTYVCFHCGLRKKQVKIRTFVNRAHPTYRVWEYSLDGGKIWKWIRNREKKPRCRNYPMRRKARSFRSGM